MNRRALIDARTNILYGSFYITGLIHIFGKRNVKFVSKPFSNLPIVDKNIRFIIQEGDKSIKVFIHTDDQYQIFLKQYDWCDIYGHVNANFKHYPKENFPKQISLAPSFAIRNFNLFNTISYSPLVGQ